MDALTNTNAPMMYDLRRFANEVMGVKGVRMRTDSPEFKFIADQAKKFNDMRMQALAAGPQAEPKFMSITNAEGRVIDVLIKPNGEPMVVEPKVQNTQQGMFTMSNPTNAVPLVDPRTGQQLQGYAADPMMGGPSPAPLAGGGMAATNAPAASPTQTPAPSPTPFPEGAVVRDKRNGKIYKVINGQLVPGEDVPAGP
jgi:hypothetical protein